MVNGILSLFSSWRRIINWPGFALAAISGAAV